MKKEYDLIVSLGENCMVANNLRYRLMRPFSLPFDRVYMENERTLRYLIEGFKDRFSRLLLKDNIEKIKGSDEHKIVYKDNYSGYCFPNHFENEILTDNEYKKVHDTLRRRIDRLFNSLENSYSILFILAGELSFNEEDILEFKKTLLKLYPAKDITIRVMIFNYKDNEENVIDNNISIYKYIRPMNLYDFTKTNYEWSFLDDIKLSNVNYKKNSIKLFSLKIKDKKYRLDLSWY